MGALIALLLLIGLAVLWAFFIFVPDWVDERALRVFNWSVIACCVMICGSWIMFMKVQLGIDASNEKFRWAFITAGALMIEIVFLTFMLLLRNFWVFKPPSRPGSGWFG